MNNLSRSIGLLLITLLSACDADKSPTPHAPTPKVSIESPSVETKTAGQSDVNSSQSGVKPSAPLIVNAPAKPFKQVAREPEHVLAPNVVVVPVVAHSSSVKKPAIFKTNISAASSNSKSEAAAKARVQIAGKTKPSSKVVQQTRLDKPILDLTLPSEMVDQLHPVGKVQPIIHKAVLPPMFSEKKSTKDSPFQLNGRLLSNQMQLQLRDESHREVEGAALDFEFKQ
ncbi:MULTISPECIES: translation initiation factor 2 [unclassified Pseudomonas]|uniref:translation initiation factor 2 n=1 Tax=unclassified Pseudomonas TaxID=196821 RepID=UPI002B239F0F|nr:MULTISPECIES: translation initiation factor 2 [unclassified Pseudomonas]MEA9975775.1 translation initiation factor 2 [Pseudomonas sp. RTS4]MEB0197564.1 translation initiation factor 2 [Pseudomonas sp. 5S4]MEB0244949.1 translation initiation factor 2 [Pseudomonas sp. 10S5]